MLKEAAFTKYQERGPYHWDEAKRSIRKFNAHQEARFQWILRCLGDVKEKTVLDVGCGDGVLTYRIVKKGANAIGLDSSEDAIKLAKEIFSGKNLPAKFILADAHEMPIENNSIDCVVLGEVLEHAAEPEKLLSEIQRVLRAEGKVVISTPYRLSEVPSDEFHIKEYYPSELKHLLSKYFSDIEIIETHPAFWTFAYDYGVPWFRRRPLFRWLINVFVLSFRWNPFLKDNSNRKRFDYFTQITALAQKNENINASG